MKNYSDGNLCVCVYAYSNYICVCFGFIIDFLVFKYTVMENKNDTLNLTS